MIVNGALGIGGIVAYPLENTTVSVLSGLALWTVVFPASTVLLAISFRRRMREGSLTRAV